MLKNPQLILESSSFPRSCDLFHRLPQQVARAADGATKGGTNPRKGGTDEFLWKIWDKPWENHGNTMNTGEKTETLEIEG